MFVLRIFFILRLPCRCCFVILWPEINLFFICSCHLNFFLTFFSILSRFDWKLNGAERTRTTHSTSYFSVKSFYKLRLEFCDIDGFLFVENTQTHTLSNANFPNSKSSLGWCVRWSRELWEMQCRTFRKSSIGMWERIVIVGSADVRDAPSLINSPLLLGGENEESRNENEIGSEQWNSFKNPRNVNFSIFKSLQFSPSGII